MMMTLWVAGLYTTIQPTDKLSFNFRGEIVDATEIGTGGNPVGIVLVGLRPMSDTMPTKSRPRFSINCGPMC